MGRGPRNHRPDLNGLIVVDKPLGMTSMDVLRRVRRATGGAKVGHAGTLDPLATGVLVVLLGRGTRAVERIMGMTKVYEAVVDLSGCTTTDDREGQILMEGEAGRGRREERSAEGRGRLDLRAAVEAAIPRFLGVIEQRAPAYSAVHVGGQRAYKLARRGEAVEMPIRRVRIDAIEVLGGETESRVAGSEFPGVALRVTCGRGTYIRSLARDLGLAVGPGGHLASLRRTRVGDYRIDEAWTMDRVEQGIGPSDLRSAPGAEAGAGAEAEAPPGTNDR